MSTSLEEQIKQLRSTIAEMESQRAILGDDTVTSALIPLKEKLATLEEQVELPEPTLPTRQRKLVTLLFMDVVGSTEMTRHLDPEDTLEIMDASLRRLAVPVEAHGGHVTRFMGDGFKAVFGDPVAREDDPEQAIRAGLEILKISQALAQELVLEWGMEDFQVRIGINTGLVALGGYTEAEDTVMGHPVNLAARIEGAAPPGGLLISHNTYRHVRGVFNVDPIESITAKGFPEPVQVYLVREIKPRAFRVQTRGVEGVETRMVGRHDELKLLQDALLTAIEEGEGQVVTISGEAGVGKSRLLYEFENWIELLPPSQDVRFFQGRGRQEAQGLPYSLLRDVFTFRFQILDGDPSDQARRKIEAGFGEVLIKESDGIMRPHILGQLLGFDFSASPHLKGVLNDAEQLRNRGLIYLMEYFQSLSQEMPIVIFLEDVHWGDDSSLNIVNKLGEYTPKYPVLIVCAARPSLYERRPYWGEGQTYHTNLELHPLSKRESRQLVAEILKLVGEIPLDLRELVVSGAEGNPFYMEELIKMLIEDGVVIPDEESWQIDMTRLETIDVPSTLAGVLQSRLDSLPLQERTVLQQASVIGRLFWDRIVAYIQAEGRNGGDPQLIPQTLTSLRNRELVYRHEESAFVGAVEYLFKHDVLREVTYESVIKHLRKTYHGFVADWLIDNSSDRIGEYCGLIAEHLLLAKRPEQACEYFSQAGDTALAAFANTEAETYFRQALELSPADRLRANIFSGLGEALYRQGQSEEAEQIWQQAIILYREMGDRDHMADTYSRLSWLLFDTDDYLKAWNLCNEGLESMAGAPDSPGYARLLCEAGRMAFQCNFGEQSITLAKRAQDMAAKVGEKEVEGSAKFLLIVGMENISEFIALLEELIAWGEKEGLLRFSARMHANICADYDDYLIDVEAAIRHSTQSVQLYRQIASIEGLIFALRNLWFASREHGRLYDIEELVKKNLEGLAIPEDKLRSLIDEINPTFLLTRGDWHSALNVYLSRMEELRRGKTTQHIHAYNFYIKESILELNRFDNYNDLHEAEKAEKENVQINWRGCDLPLFSLSVVYARQGRMAEAHKCFAKALDDIGEYENNTHREFRSWAEFEISMAEENWNKAIAACLESISIVKQSGHRWRWARRLIDLGDALIGRNEPGDKERARETYQQSLDMFTEMGAPGYIEVLEERLGDPGPVPERRD